VSWRYIDVVFAIVALAAIPVALYSKKRWIPVCMAIALFVAHSLLLHFELDIVKRVVSTNAVSRGVSPEAVTEVLLALKELAYLQLPIRLATGLTALALLLLVVFSRWRRS
jgi:hypothetical protein